MCWVKFSKLKYIVVSSAYIKNVSLLLIFIKSFIRILKKNDPKIDPWGTPAFISVISHINITYIDHVFISDQLQDSTVGCAILPYDVENTSDHLPMKTTITLQTEQPTETNEADHSNKCITSKIDWNVNDIIVLGTLIM